MSSLTVICPNLRRYPVKVTPGTLLHKIVEEVCLKSGYDVNCCVAKNQGKIVDLALPFRLSGLPNNATIELTVTEKATNQKVELALQLPDGGRQMATFELATSLKDVLAYFSGIFNQDLLSFETGAPGCVYMNKKYVGPELEYTSLSSMGITGGKCLLRYQKIVISQEELSKLEEKVILEQKRLASLNSTFTTAKAENEERKRIEEEREAKFEAECRIKEEEERKRREEEAKRLKEEDERAAQMEVDQAPVPARISDQLPDPPTNNNGGWSFDSPFAQRNDSSLEVPLQTGRLAHLNSLLQQVERSIVTGSTDNMVEVMANSGSMSLSQIEAATKIIELELEPSAPVFDDACPRNVILFPRIEESQEIGDEPMPEETDEFFEVSVEDAKSIQKDRRNEVKMQTQRSLIPRSFVEKKNRELKREAYKHTVLRFVIGDQLIQANFRSGEPISRVFEEVANFFQGRIDFSLSAVLNQAVENSDSKNLIEADLSPKSTLTVKVKGNSDPLALLKPEILKGSHEEANKLSREWLSVNTKFTQYTGVMAEEERTMKRPATARDYEPSVPGNNRSVAPGPKWFKHK